MPDARSVGRFCTKEGQGRESGEGMCRRASQAPGNADAALTWVTLRRVWLHQATAHRGWGPAARRDGSGSARGFVAAGEGRRWCRRGLRTGDSGYRGSSSEEPRTESDAQGNMSRGLQVRGADRAWQTRRGIRYGTNHSRGRELLPPAYPVPVDRRQ